METLFDIPIMTFADSSAWQEWLAQNYTLQTGVWIKIAKKGSGVSSINHLEALDEALCYGWIDGQRRSFDETYFLQKFTPRRARSLWSKVNIGKVEALTAAGRMQPSGQQAIADAKADGRWDAAYESPRNATVPADLADALEQNAAAKNAFNALSKTDQYSILHNLMTAQNPKTRMARLLKIIDKLQST